MSSTSGTNVGKNPRLSRSRSQLDFQVVDNYPPILLGGQGGGRIATGEHRRYDRDTPLANLYLSMLDALGVPAERFADSTGRLPGVLA